MCESGSGDHFWKLGGIKTVRDVRRGFLLRKYLHISCIYGIQVMWFWYSFFQTAAV